MFNFADSVTASLGDLLTRHHLVIAKVSDDEILLVGNGYALSLRADRDYATLGLVDWSEKKKCFMWHSANQLLAERAATYRKKNVNLVGLEEHINASIKAIAEALRDRCQEILEGDFSWLHAKMKKDPSGWVGTALPPAAQALLTARRALADPHRDL